MSHVTRFVVLAERRLVRLLVAVLPLIGLISALWWPQAAHSQTGNSHKIATDLRDVLQSPSAAARASWARDTSSGRYVRVLVVSNSPDPELTELRAHVLAAGGSVYYRYLAVSALSVLLPADRVAEIAQRADVQSI
ncbi:hypothetical protein, partial [Ideonella azotifigens]